MKVVVVVATIREEQISQFVDNWESEFEGHKLIIVEDNPTSSFDEVIPYISEKGWITHYIWEDIDEDLGENSWIIPRRTSAIKSYGIWKAWQDKPDMIVVLDDDCYPRQRGESFLDLHYRKLSIEQKMTAWVPTIEGAKPRGMPYRNCDRYVRAVFNHGLWTQNPDLDAITQLGFKEEDPMDFVELPNLTIPRHMYFPMSGMNIAFLPKIAPLMYFLLMGKDWPYDRFDDIWCGILMKKVCDHLGLWVRSGFPTVRHSKASDVWINLEKERPGIPVNEKFWQLVDAIELEGTDIISCYKELAEELFYGTEGDYWWKLKEAMQLWVELFVDKED